MNESTHDESIENESIPANNVDDAESTCSMDTTKSNSNQLPNSVSISSFTFGPNDTCEDIISKHSKLQVY